MLYYVVCHIVLCIIFHEVQVLSLCVSYVCCEIFHILHFFTFISCRSMGLILYEQHILIFLRFIGHIRHQLMICAAFTQRTIFDFYRGMVYVNKTVAVVELLSKKEIRI